MAPVPRCRLLAGGSIGAALACVGFGSPRLAQLIANSTLLAGGALCIGLPLGTVWGASVTKVDVAGRRWLLMLLGSMLVVPLAVQAGAWQAALGPGGWFAQWRGVSAYAQTPLHGMQGAIWVHGMAAAPWIAVFVAASLATAPRQLEEQALLEGSAIRVFWRVSLPYAMSGWLAGSLWIVVLCGTEIAVVDFFLTSAQENTLGEEIYNIAVLGGAWAFGSQDGANVTPRSGGPLDPSDLVQGCLFYAFLALACVVVLVSKLAVGSPELGARWMWRPERRPLATLATWFMILICVGIPLAALTIRAGTVVSNVDGHATREWSASAMLGHVALSPWQARREWGWTLWIGAWASVLAASLAFISCWFARQSRWVAATAVAAVVAAFAIPGPLWAEASIVLLNRPAGSAWGWLNWLYDRTIVAPVAVQTIRALPAVQLLLWTVVRGVPEELLEIARLDGAGAWQRMAYIGAPLCARGIVKGAALGLALAIGEASATLLVTPPGVTPLAVRLFGLLHYGIDAQAAALCLTLFLACGFLSFALGNWLVPSPLHGERRSSR